MQSMAAPAESPVPEGQPPSADGPTANDSGGGGGDSSGGALGGESGTGEERFSDPNGTPAETSLKEPDAAEANDDGLDVLQITQYGLAGLTGALLLATVGIYLMRKRGIGFFR